MLAASMSVNVGDGPSAKLWTDRWSAAGVLREFASALYAATSPAGRRRTLCDALHGNCWVADITGALTTQVVCDYLRVWEILRAVTLQPETPGRFVWRWSSSGTYSASSTYRAFFAGSVKLLGATELWRTRAPPKVKLFFWLALHHRLWTADRRKRHGLQDDDECALCCQHAETVGHLLLGCVFARQIWFELLAPLGIIIHCCSPVYILMLGLCSPLLKFKRTKLLILYNFWHVTVHFGNLNNRCISSFIHVAFVQTGQVGFRTVSL